MACVFTRLGKDSEHPNGLQVLGTITLEGHGQRQATAARQPEIALQPIHSLVHTPHQKLPRPLLRCCWWTNPPLSSSRFSDLQAEMISCSNERFVGLHLNRPQRYCDKSKTKKTNKVHQEVWSSGVARISHKVIHFE